jgi:hypothetical protein
MSDQDPCQGCRHLVQHPWPQRPDCARGAYYGERHCRREAVVRSEWRSVRRERAQRDG